MTDRLKELCRQGGTVRKAVAKLLRMIEGETERLPEEGDMSHLRRGRIARLP